MNTVNKFKKSFFAKFIVFCIVISVLSIYVNFNDGQILKGILSFIQAGLYIVSWMMGMQFIKEKKHSYHLLPAALALLLIIPYMGLHNSPTHDSIKIKWEDDIVLSSILPEPSSSTVDILINSDSSLYVSIYKISISEYNEYINECVEQGFIVGSEVDTSSYKAFNEQGYELFLHYSEYSEEMNIELNSPIQLNEISWPNSDLSKLIPTPKSTFGNIATESSDRISIYIGNTSIDDYNEYVIACMDLGFNLEYSKDNNSFTAYNKTAHTVSIKHENNNIMHITLAKPSQYDVDYLNKALNEDNEISSTLEDESSSKDVVIEDESQKADDEITSEDAQVTLTGIRQEFKDAMDSYELFFDEYIEFMNKYSENENDISVALDYANFLAQFSETMQDLEEISEDDLSDEEFLYYTEVMLRINQKLLTVQ